MKLNETKLKAIDKRFTKLKRENPIDSYCIGIGIELIDGLHGSSLCKNGVVFADAEELGRMIEELQMLKQAIEEETGLIL